MKKQDKKDKKERSAKKKLGKKRKEEEEADKASSAGGAESRSVYSTKTQRTLLVIDSESRDWRPLFSAIHGAAQKYITA